MKVFFLAILSSIFFIGCSKCITGGRLEISETYVSNSCGLLNGVSVSEISVDSLINNIPFKYTNKKSGILYQDGATPEKMPRKLFYSKNCKYLYLWQDGKIVDTLQSPFTFLRVNWYRFYSMDSHEEVFMHIDSLGNRNFHHISHKSSLTNW